MDKKIELTVREIDIAKFEAGSSYLIVIDPTSHVAKYGEEIEKYLYNSLKVKAAVIVAEVEKIKVYGLPKEPK